jgi:hypothetical protein
MLSIKSVAPPELAISVKRSRALPLKPIVARKFVHPLGTVLPGLKTIAFEPTATWPARAFRTPDLPTPASPRISTYRPMSRAAFIASNRARRASVVRPMRSPISRRAPRDAYNHVIERISFTCTLKLDAIDNGAGKTSRVSIKQQGEQVVSGYLGFELRSGWTCGCRACRARHHPPTYYAVDPLVEFKSITIFLTRARI